MKKQCNIVELFSGIGSQAKALKNLGYTVNALGTCEWDIHAFIAYDAIHSSAEIPAEIDVLTKKELLDILQGYTLSNSGKEKMDFKTLRTYSEPVLKRILTAIRRNSNYGYVLHFILIIIIGRYRNVFQKIVVNIYRRFNQFISFPLHYAEFKIQ